MNKNTPKQNIILIVIFILEVALALAIWLIPSKITPQFFPKEGAVFLSETVQQQFHPVTGQEILLNGVTVGFNDPVTATTLPLDSSFVVYKKGEKLLVMKLKGEITLGKKIY